MGGTMYYFMGLLFILSGMAFAADQPQLSGDIRYRVDRTDQQGSDVRLRHRIRGRIGIKGELSQKLSYGFRVASGGDDAPTSANATLDGGFSSKNIYFDRIYIQYQLRDHLNLFAGKMENPFYRVGKNHMFFDGDVAPEGLAIKYDSKILFAQLGHFILEESSTSSDTTMMGTQIGAMFNLGAASMKMGLGYYDYMAIRNHDSLYYSADGKGNTLSASNKYSNDYDLAQLFFSLKSKSVEFFGDYIKNIAIGDDSWGFVMGVSYKTDSWVTFYNYRQLEKDAAIGALADSDFGGGGTNNKGHLLGIGHYFAKYSRISLTHFVAKTAISGGDNYHRTFLDYKLNF